MLSVTLDVMLNREQRITKCVLLRNARLQINHSVGHQYFFHINFWFISETSITTTSVLLSCKLHVIIFLITVVKITFFTRHQGKILPSLVETKINLQNYLIKSRKHLFCKPTTNTITNVEN